MYNSDNRLNDAIEKMSETEKRELLNQLENRNTVSVDVNIIESIVNISLEVTSIIAKIFRIV
jgi:hypothetical protein